MDMISFTSPPSYGIFSYKQKLYKAHLNFLVNCTAFVAALMQNLIMKGLTVPV